MAARLSALLPLLLFFLCDNLESSQAEDPPVFEVDNCDNVLEFWKDLCLQGKCIPRTDGGCRKPSASGVCTTRGGCMQGDLDSMAHISPSPPRPERLGPYEVADPETPEPRYLNLISPASGDTFDAGAEIEIRFQVEVTMLKETFDELLATAGNKEQRSFTLPDLGFGAYAVVQVDGEEEGVLGQEGGVTGSLLESPADAFPGPDFPPTSIHSAIFSLSLAVASLSPGPHTLTVDIRDGIQGPPPPSHAWILINAPGAKQNPTGKEIEGVERVMTRVLELEEELAYLRALVDKQAAKQHAIREKKNRAPKHLVIELGANDGSWIRSFCERNPHFEPHIFEPQPRFAPLLSSVAAKYNGQHNQKAAWVEEGKKLTFHAHADEGGVGSSLFDDHAYGKCGSRVCKQDFSETYEVETVDFVGYLRRIALPHDMIILRMDIEGAEYEVARRMVAEGVACWIDFWEFEGHALYSPATAKYRPVDAVLPWLLKDCGVKMVVQDWYTEDWKVYSAWNESDACKLCPLPVISDDLLATSSDHN